MNGPYITIGLTGRAGAGKDTVAGILSGMYGFESFAFADALRQEIVGAFGVDPRRLTDRDRKETPDIALAIGRCNDGRFIARMHQLGHEISLARSPRQIMQWWGTDYRRSLDGSDYWLDRARETLEELHRGGYGKVAITDVRFPNEAEFIAALSGELWRIRRHKADHAVPQHESERHISSFSVSCEISNETALEALIDNVVAAYCDARNVAFAGS